MRKIIFVWLMVMILLALSGCSKDKNVASKDNQMKNMQIGISVYDEYDTFIECIMINFSKAVMEKEREENITINVDVVSANGSQLTQNDQIEQFVEQGYDVICVNLVDRTDPSMIIDKVKNGNIPTIFFNRELVEEDLERWESLYYVGAVALESGIMQGEILKNLCRKEFSAIDRNNDGKIQYVMLEGEFGHQDALLRTEYVIQTIMNAGFSVERLGDEAANWNRAQAETKMHGWLEEYGESIEVVFANNDEMALGAIEALKKEGITEDTWPLVLGIDGIQEALEAIEREEMTGTVLNDAKGQAKSMLELAYSITTQKELEPGIELVDGKYIRLPHKIVTKENVEEIKESIRP